MLIGISGKKQSGKNTFANMLQYCLFLHMLSNRRTALAKSIGRRDLFEGFDKNVLSNNYSKEYLYNLNRNARFVQISFAKPLKEICSVLLNVSVTKFEEAEFKNSKSNIGNYTNRELLIKVAEDLKKLDNDIFIKILFNSIKDNHYWSYIITDVRYKNEFNALKNKEAYLIRIERDNNPEVHLDHISETDLDDSIDKFDNIIYNDSNLKDLFIKANELSIKLLKNNNYVQ